LAGQRTQHQRSFNSLGRRSRVTVRLRPPRLKTLPMPTSAAWRRLPSIWP